MLKRKYGDRSDWGRVLNRKYAQTYLDTKGFNGYITLLEIEKVTEPLFANYSGKQICLVDEGYMWLQHFPLDKNHSVTTMFDAKGNIVQWYIDICLEIECDEDIPWMDDLFLDIVVLPSGEVFHKDDDELEEALLAGVIDESLYALAREEARMLTDLIMNEKFELFQFSNKHREMLLDKLK